ncbi:MAG: NCS2 family permease [Sarcina sp.]
MNKIFKLKEHNTNVKIELIAGLTSFFAAVYIVVVNASILSDGGKGMQPLIIATVLASIAGCLLVAFISNTPLVIMPGMGINALFTYTIVQTMGLSFEQALTAVIVSGILFTIIAVTPLSDLLDKGIPHSLKAAITVGIGLFITFLGLQKAGLVIGDTATLVKMASLGQAHILVFVLTLILMVILFIKKIPGNFLIGIVFGTILSIILGDTNFSTAGFALPSFSEYSSVFMKFDFSGIFNMNFWIAVFSLTLVLVFENVGLLHAQVNGMLDAPDKNKKALMSVALSTIACGIFGTSPSVSTVEGQSGIISGGKTGLTAVFAAFFILLSLFCIPTITLIPNAAIAPILIIIGSLMMANIKEIDFLDFSESFPVFILFVLIPLTFSIVDGMAFGFILYPITKICVKKGKEVPIPTYVVSAIFLLYLLMHVFNL